MPVERKRRISLVVHKGAEPEIPAKAELQRLRLNLVDAHQQFERVNQGSSRLKKRVRHQGPMMVVQVGDVHTGSPYSDTEAVNQIREVILNTSGAVAVLTGDIIESLAPEKGAVPWSTLDINAQIDTAKGSLIDPLWGRVLGAVSGHFAHEGNVDKHGVYPSKSLYPSDLILQQGGVVSVSWSDQARADLQLWHKKGGRGIQPARGLTDLALRTDTRTRSHYYGKGHDHESFIQEQYTGKSPDEMPSVAVVNGSPKGSNPRLPRDPYGIALGVDLADPLGQGGIFRPLIYNGSETGRVDVYPFHTLKEGKTLQTAFQLLDCVERQRLRGELIGRIYKDVEKPKVRISLRKSIETGRALKEFSGSSESGEELEKQWDRVVVDIVTNMPFGLWPVQNVRWSSTYGGEAELKEFVENNLVNDPHSFAVLLRSVVDKDLAKKGHGERESELHSLANLFRKVKNQTLAVMLDENLRGADWMKELDEDSQPIAAGSRLARRIEAPLIHNKSVLEIRSRYNDCVPRVLSIGLVDRLGLYGSSVNATHGLVRMYWWEFDEKPGILIGGHMAKSGIARLFDRSNPETNSPGFIAPGWFAEYVDTRGKGNVQEGARPGQAVIVMPPSENGGNLFFLGASERKSRDIKDALTLWRGLNLLGLTDAVTKRNYRRG